MILLTVNRSSSRKMRHAGLVFNILMVFIITGVIYLLIGYVFNVAL